MREATLKRMKQGYDEDRELFEEGKARIQKSNLRALCYLTKVTMLLAVFLILIAPLFLENWKPSVFHYILVLTMSFFAVLAEVMARKNIRNEMWTSVCTWGFLSSVVFLLMMMDTADSPTATQSFTSVLMILTPVIFIVPFLQMLRMELLYLVVFLVLTRYFKAPAYSNIDSFEALLGFFIGLVLYMLVMRVRMDDYQLQKEREGQYEEVLRLRMLNLQKAEATALFNLTKNTAIDTATKDPALQAIMDRYLDGILEAVYEGTKSGKPIARNREEMIRQYKGGKKRFWVRHQLEGDTRWFETIFEVITNPYTKDIEASGMLMDVSDKVRSEKIVSHLISSDYDIIVALNLKTGEGYTYYGLSGEDTNRETIKYQKEKGSTEESLVQFYREFCVPEDRDRAIRENSMANIRAQLETKGEYETYYAVKMEGKVLHKRAIYAYLDDTRDYLLSSVLDVTAAIKKEEQHNQLLMKALEEANGANEVKSAFMSRVSHDMKTPMNGILGLTALIKSNTTDDAIRKDLEGIEISGQYLLELIDDVLDYSSILHNEQQLHPTVCDARVLFRNFTRYAKTQAEEKGIRFNISLTGEQHTMFNIDAARINQIFVNLCGNAFKFTEPGGEVDFSIAALSEENGVVTEEVMIKDTGIGMSEKFLASLYEPFAQENLSRKNTNRGTGLGLCISKQLIELMGGALEISSKQGEGTEVRLVLPLQLATPEELAEWEGKQPEEKPKKLLASKRVLVVEDNALNATIAERLLKAKGMEIDLAQNGLKGVEAYRQSPVGYYSAVLMDIRMPVLDGLEATRIIRATEREDAAKIPIIAVSANNQPSDKELSLKAGINEHLGKPIIPEQLYGALERYLQH